MLPHPISVAIQLLQLSVSFIAPQLVRIVLRMMLLRSSTKTVDWGLLVSGMGGVIISLNVVTYQISLFAVMAFAA